MTVHIAENQRRAGIFKELRALFEFDSKGALPCLVSGMAGPIDMPIGYLDLAKVKLNGQAIGGVLVITWQGEEVALLVRQAANQARGADDQRPATTEEMLCALHHYKNAVLEYREEILKQFKIAGREVSPGIQKRLGLAPYFDGAPTYVA